MNEQYVGILIGFPLLQGFTSQGAQMLLDSGVVKPFSAGAVLFTEGDPATYTCLILMGKLEVFTHRDGQEQVLREACPGEMLGELGVLCNIPRTASARAVQDAALLVWSPDDFRRLLLRSGLLSERVLGQSLRNLIEKERSLLEALGRSQNAG